MPERSANGTTRGPAEQPFTARPESVEMVRRFVWERTAGAGLPSDWIHDLVLAVSEAATNAVVHSGSDRIELELAAREDRVEVRIVDHGVFRGRVPIPELDGAAGRGLPLMMALVDEVSLHEGTPQAPGTEVRLVKRTPLRYET